MSATTGPRPICWRDERGITGIETAIVLIAFVVVASVFAFTLLSTGIAATEQTRETVLGGLGDVSATLVLRGSVIAIAAGSLESIDIIKFQIANASQQGEAVDLSSSGSIVSYVDADQQTNLAFVPFPATTTGWGTNWLIGNAPLLRPGNRVEIIVNLTGLTTPLAARKEFTIRLQPNRGAVLPVSRRTPAELTGVADLR